MWLQPQLPVWSRAHSFSLVALSFLLCGMAGWHEIRHHELSCVECPPPFSWWCLLRERFWGLGKVAGWIVRLSCQSVEGLDWGVLVCLNFAGPLAVKSSYPSDLLISHYGGDAEEHATADRKSPPCGQSLCLSPSVLGAW